MAARNKTSGHDVVPSLTSHQNSKLNAIHEGSLDHLTNEQGVSRVRKRDLIAGAWQEAASRIPNKSMPIPFRLSISIPCKIKSRPSTTRNYETETWHDSSVFCHAPVVGSRTQCDTDCTRLPTMFLGYCCTVTFFLFQWIRS